jgi:hypothetical protein
VQFSYFTLSGNHYVDHRRSANPLVADILDEALYAEEGGMHSEETAARARQVRYYRECAIAAFPGDPATAPPSYRYFLEIVDRLSKVRPQDLSENSVLLGSSAQIADALGKVAAAGIDEVILYSKCRAEAAPPRSSTRWPALWPKSLPAFDVNGFVAGFPPGFLLFGDTRVG